MLASCEAGSSRHNGEIVTPLLDEMEHTISGENIMNHDKVTWSDGETNRHHSVTIVCTNYLLPL
jgi:hypothetical protein